MKKTICLCFMLLGILLITGCNDSKESVSFTGESDDWTVELTVESAESVGSYLHEIEMNVKPIGDDYSFEATDTFSYHLEMSELGISKQAEDFEVTVDVRAYHITDSFTTEQPFNASQSIQLTLTWQDRTDTIDLTPITE
ncbi:hypothetical protein DES38_101260 [Streptohalobacillus salinus]|uniref:Uncharacterized protein n=1 Tax=Streptohalobacillus salinus TaxID=621096 RepID=A0A2V3WI04_9BACI|nr:hypothetical protein [Streptohalobacillus salinus]PXW93174.1 hypothetical protein DES38_101260 [Streptohalobacillus salinus]